MAADFVATATIVVESTPEDIWDALIDPDRVRQYMFGTNVVSDWEVGLAITWQGEWNGKPYQDKGEVLEIEPHRRLRYSHYSPMSGEPDLPENYHTPPPPPPPGGGVMTEDRRRALAARQNFGFARVERLAGNVGYVDIRAFMPLPLVAETAAAAMTFLAGTDALIIDMRNNRGGSPETVAFVTSYLFGPQPVRT